MLELMHVLFDILQLCLHQEVHVVGHKNEGKDVHVRVRRRLNGNKVHPNPEVIQVTEPEFVLQMVRANKPNLSHNKLGLIRQASGPKDENNYRCNE